VKRTTVTSSLAPCRGMHVMGRSSSFQSVMAALFGYAIPDDLCGSDMRTLLAPMSMPPGRTSPGLFAGLLLPRNVTSYKAYVRIMRALAGGLPLCGFLKACQPCLSPVSTSPHVITSRPSRQSHTMHPWALSRGIAHDFNNMLAAILATQNCHG